MKKTKELLKIVIAMALIAIALLLGNSMNMEAKAAKQNTVIFHYQRTDGDYTGWNIYHWGPDNGSVKFSAEDSFGKIAVLKFDGDVSEVGFIVRKSTESNEWESKDPDGDRFIKVEYFKDGVAEVWLYSGQSEFDKTCPAGYEPFTGTIEEPTTEPPKDMEIEGDTITVKLHYYRSGGDYKDWNVHYWTGSKAYDGVFDFNGEDEFGKIATYQFPADIDELGFIVRRGEWLEKDYDGDRYIDLSKVKDGVIDLWVVSGDEKVYYDKNEIGSFEEESEPPMVTIPAYSGKSLEEVKAMFNEIGLSAIIQYVTNDMVKAGDIISLNVKAGDNVVKGTEVVIYVSIGPDKDDIEEITTAKTETETTTKEAIVGDETISEDEKIEEESTTSNKNEPSYEFDTDDDDEEESYLAIIVAIIAGVVALISVIIAIIVIKKK